MATHARIAIELENGEYLSSYQHWDGHPGCLGFNLISNWTKYDKVLEAISLGDASKWGQIVGEKVDFNDADNPLHKVQNIYYGRDRGDEDTDALIFDDIDELMDNAFLNGEQFLYVMNLEGEWLYKDKNPKSQLELAYVDSVKEHSKVWTLWAESKEWLISRATI